MNTTSQHFADKLTEMLEVCDIDNILFRRQLELYGGESHLSDMGTFAMYLICKKAGLKWLSSYFYCGYTVDNFVITCSIDKNYLVKRLLEVNLFDRNDAWEYIFNEFAKAKTAA